jgi:hypothetical protein
MHSSASLIFLVTLLSAPGALSYLTRREASLIIAARSPEPSGGSSKPKLGKINTSNLGPSVPDGPTGPQHAPSWNDGNRVGPPSGSPVQIDGRVGGPENYRGGISKTPNNSPASGNRRRSVYLDDVLDFLYERRDLDNYGGLSARSAYADPDAELYEFEDLYGY